MGTTFREDMLGKRPGFHEEVVEETQEYPKEVKEESHVVQGHASGSMDPANVSVEVQGVCEEEDTEEGTKEKGYPISAGSLRVEKDEHCEESDDAKNRVD
ncbi:ATP-binding cassette sub-family C member 1 [Caligus rogercresseyi]|uniref:ATP-binding cassette sub-family C member 1 n=1 Tax=Caligus rogercresseyi TaxID=217165 RepID=A0A7T8JU09_CALRO|nr:ATP-binding cassette sub-family C member 1 [Caligus rogercresseyi]QQP33100.1 ATP-binding cassette sub-family C member 1 [Caligus rogercresseyi]